MLDLKALAATLAEIPVCRREPVPVPSLAPTVPVRSYLFRSLEDPDYPPDPEVCAAAPFEANLWLGGSLWSVAEGAEDGRVPAGSTRRIGWATACARITDAAFPVGLRQSFHVRFDLPEGSYTATGECALISNDVPQAGLVLASCQLRVVEAPPGIAGGIATSLSVFNPHRLAGFATGSLWTLQVYETP